MRPVSQELLVRACGSAVRGELLGPRAGVEPRRHRAAHRHQHPVSDPSVCARACACWKVFFAGPGTCARDHSCSSRYEMRFVYTDAVLMKLAPLRARAPALLFTLQKVSQVTCFITRHNFYFSCIISLRSSSIRPKHHITVLCDTHDIFRYYSGA